MHDPGVPLAVTVLVVSMLSAMYIALGVVTTMFLKDESERFRQGSLTDDAYLVVLALMTILWPVLALGLIGYGIKLGVPALGRATLSAGRGMRDLYRMVIPAKVELPKAQARDRKSA